MSAFPGVLSQLADAWSSSWTCTNRLEGKIKSFNPVKGFGFIECEALKQQGMNDAFLHHSQLGTFTVGDVVTFSVNFNRRGQPQASCLMPAVATPQLYVPAPTALNADAKSSKPGGLQGWMPIDLHRYNLDADDMGSKIRHGRIKSFDSNSGYGFIESGDLTAMGSQDIFLHRSELRSLQVGDEVSFTVRCNYKGQPQALGVRALHLNLTVATLNGAVYKIDRLLSTDPLSNLHSQVQHATKWPLWQVCLAVRDRVFCHRQRDASKSFHELDIHSGSQISVVRTLVQVYERYWWNWDNKFGGCWAFKTRVCMRSDGTCLLLRIELRDDHEDISRATPREWQVRKGWYREEGAEFVFDWSHVLKQRTARLAWSVCDAEHDGLCDVSGDQVMRFTDVRVKASGRRAFFGEDTGWQRLDGEEADDLLDEDALRCGRVLGLDGIPVADALPQLLEISS